MDLEKLATRARSTLLLVSFVGVLVLGLGVLLIFAVISDTTKFTNQSGLTWVDGLTR